MALTKSELVYTDYKWTAQADHDNPYYRAGTDYSQIDKTQGYEVLYFLNHIGAKLWTNPNIATYNKMERILRNNVPGHSTHKAAEDFIIRNWDRY